MKNVLLVVTVLVAFLATGCTKEQAKESLQDVVNKLACDVEKKATDAVADAIVKELQCAKADVVKLDVAKKIGEAKLCKKDEAPAPAVAMKSASVLLPACGFVGSFATSLAASQIPAEWECSAADAKAKLEAAILKGCEQLFPKPAAAPAAAPEVKK